MTRTGGEPLPAADRVALAALATVAAVTAPVWAATALATMLAHGRLSELTAGAVVAGALTWPAHLTDPAEGFPRGAGLPGPWLLNGCLLGVLAAATVGALTGVRLWRRRRPAQAGWAPRRELERGLSARAVRRRATHARPAAAGTEPREVGVALGRDRRSGLQLWGSVEDSYLYLGPPRCGKGVHLVIPQTLDAPGAVVVTATRPDTLQHTLALRAARGPVVVFDPQGQAPGVPRLRWAPQHGCTDPLVAIARARALAAGAPNEAAGSANDAWWRAMTEAVLRCYLHAAALSGAGMRELLAWVTRPTDPTPVRVLRAHPEAAPGWAEELAGQAAADPRQRDGVWGGVRRAVDSVADPRVLDACSPDPGEQFDAEAFLRERGTLYLLGTGGTQLSVAPLVTALIEDLLDTARRLAARSPGGRLEPPLRLLLDEAANIAPLPSLPSLLSDGGGCGITTIAVLQSLAQARARWGPYATDALWDAATTKVIFGGLAHAEDLHRISQLAGDVDDPTHTRTRGRDGTTVATSMRRLPALPVQTLRTLPPGRAVVLARTTPPVDAALTPWWDRPDAEGVRAGARAWDRP